MAEVVKYVRSRKEEARVLLPESLHHYFESRILATSWHPEEDYLALMRVVIKLLPGSPGVTGLEVWEAAARRTNQVYFEGPYKSLIYQGDPQRSLSKLHSLWRMRHDTGEVSVVADGDHAARIELRGYALVSAESCALSQGTFWGVLSYSGALEITLAHTRCRARGDELCEWRASWT